MDQSLKPEIYIFNSLEKVSHALAEMIMKISNDAVMKNGKFSLVLSGGRTPRRLYSLLASEYADKIVWEAVHLFWGDERCVARDHPDSNYAMASQTLISKIQIPAQNIHRIHTELHPPEKAAESYEEMLREFFNNPEDKISSAFDVILLGVGPDGHTASLFPQSPVLEEKSRWVAAVDAPASFSTRQRITMTFPLMNRSRAAIFLVSGAEKSTVVEMILEEPERARTIYPAARVQPRERLMWFIGEKEGGLHE